MSDIEKPNPKSLLEWLSSRSIPDSTKALIVAGMIAVILLPYAGGGTFWILGTNPSIVPSIPHQIFWIFIGATPFILLIIISRVIGAHIRNIALIFIISSISSIIYIYIVSLFPQIGLAAISPNYEHIFDLGFQEVGHSWRISHDKIPSDQYCHFRTAPQSLGPQMRDGCVFRAETIEIESGGRSYLSGVADSQAAFDLEIFLTSQPQLAENTECAPSLKWQTVKARPKSPEALGHTVIYVNKPGGITSYSATFDYLNSRVLATPAKGAKSELFRSDIVATGNNPNIQVSGWTLWGDAVGFQLDELSIHLKGRLLCAPTWTVFISDKIEKLVKNR